jgi:hypothetical protein
MAKPTRTRIDDPSAQFDAMISHLLVAMAAAIAIVAVSTPRLHHALVGAVLVALVAAVRLAFHPLRLVRLHRVYVEGDRVLVAAALGRAREVEVAAVEHETHAPWPCALVLSGGERVSFVARRDDGTPAFFLVELSDRARYERPRDARDSLTDLELATRPRA